MWVPASAHPPSGLIHRQDPYSKSCLGNFWKDFDENFIDFFKLQGFSSNVSILKMLCEFSLTVGFKADPDIDSIPITSKLLEHCFKNRGRHGGGFARAAHWIIRPDSFGSLSETTLGVSTHMRRNPNCPPSNQVADCFYAT